MLHISLSKLNGTWAWLWFEWNIPHILMHSNTWSPVGGWCGGLGRVTMLEEVRHWGRLWGLVYWDVCTLLLLQLTQCCSWHAFHNDGLLHLLSSINCLSHVFLLKWPVWYSYWQPCRLSQLNVSTLLKPDQEQLLPLKSLLVPKLRSKAFLKVKITKIIIYIKFG